VLIDTIQKASTALKKLAEHSPQAITCRRFILLWHDFKVWSDGSCDVPSLKEDPAEWPMKLSCSHSMQSRG